MDDKNTISAFSIIPEFFFDLICRITPGILFIVAVLFEYKLVSIASFSILLNSGSGFIIFIAFLLIIFGYNVGIFLSIPGKYVAKIYSKKTWDKYLENESKILDDFLNDHPLQNVSIYNDDNNLNKDLDDLAYQRIYREIHDFLKSNDDQAKGILPKLSAEASLCNNSAAALLITLLIHVIHNLYAHNYFSWFIYYWWGVIAVVLIWNGSERYERLLRSLFSYLKIVLYKKDVDLTPETPQTQSISPTVESIQNKKKSLSDKFKNIVKELIE